MAPYRDSFGWSARIGKIIVISTRRTNMRSDGITSWIMSNPHSPARTVVIIITVRKTFARADYE